MDNSTREEAVNLKMQRLREKNELLKQRHMLVEADKKRAEKRGSAVDMKHQVSVDNKPPKTKEYGSSHRAHMDTPFDERSDRYDNRRNPDYQRREPRGSQAYDYNERGDHNYNRGIRQDHRSQGRGDYRNRNDNAREWSEQDKRERRNYSHRGGSYRNGSHRNSQDPAYDRQPQQPERTDRRMTEREKQRRENIEKMEAQMTGKLQKGDDDWQDSAGFLQDPLREGAGEFARRPPPRNVRYSPHEDRPRSNRGYGRPNSQRDLEIEMTGRQRQDHERWRKQQEEADKYRLSKAQAEGGQWRREWDNEKDNKDDSERSYKQGYSGGGRGDRHQKEDYDEDRRRDRRRPHNPTDQKQKRYGDNEFHSYQGDKRPHGGNNEKVSVGEAEEWPSLQSEIHEGKEQRKKQTNRRKERRQPKTSSSDGDYNKNPLSAQEGGDSHASMDEGRSNPDSKCDQPQENREISNKRLPGEDQFIGRSGSRGKGRGRGRENRKNSASNKPGKSPKDKPHLTVDIDCKDTKDSSTANNESVAKDSESKMNPIRSHSLTSPLKTPDNFMPVGDWATEVELSSTREPQLGTDTVDLSNVAKGEEATETYKRKPEEQQLSSEMPNDSSELKSDEATETVETKEKEELVEKTEENEKEGAGDDDDDDDEEEESWKTVGSEQSDEGTEDEAEYFEEGEEAVDETNETKAGDVTPPQEIHEESSNTETDNNISEDVINVIENIVDTVKENTEVSSGEMCKVMEEEAIGSECILNDTEITTEEIKAAIGDDEGKEDAVVKDDNDIKDLKQDECKEDLGCDKHEEETCSSSDQTEVVKTGGEEPTDKETDQASASLVPSSVTTEEFVTQLSEVTVITKQIHEGII